MKFWQKIFLGVIVIFMIAFDAGAFYLTSAAYDFNRQREADNGIREQSVILSSVASRIASVEKIYPDAPTNEERLAAIIQPLVDYYRPQGVLLALFAEGGGDSMGDGDSTDDSIGYDSAGDIGGIGTDMHAMDRKILDIKDVQSKNVMDKSADGKRLLYVASQLPDYTHLTLVYARDISQIDEFRADISRAFWMLNLIVLILLAVAIYLLLRHMTKPITKLNKTAAEIADGAYGKRAAEDRSDELGALARSFNRMADSVEENMERLTKAADDRQQFIDDLSHEMKTPLTSILGYAEYLQNAKSTEGERITAAKNVRHAAERLENLSGKLSELTFLRNEDGREIEMQRVDIPALFAALEELLCPSLSSRGLYLKTQADVEAVDGDETLLLSMLTNLAENAARASQKGDTITVRAYRNDDDSGSSGGDSGGGSNCDSGGNGKGDSGGTAVFEVADTGHGMEQNEIEKITAPFYRVDKSRSREFGGVGLGLSIVSQIARLHGAELEIESAHGKGTTVRIKRRK